MPASPHLLFVLSEPTAVSTPLWKKWYIEEHIPDLVKAKVSTQAGFYQQITDGSDSQQREKFLAIYQSEYEDTLKQSMVAEGVRTTSDLFKEEHAAERALDNGKFDVRNYDLIEEVDSMENNQKSSPGVLTIEMHANGREGFEDWYREEYLKVLSEIPGHRRTLAYRIGAPTPLTNVNGIPSYLAIVGVEDVGNATKSETELRGQMRSVQGSVTNVTGWNLLHTEV